VTIASRNERVPRFSVYQLGRGSEPVIVVGSMMPAVVFNMFRVLQCPGPSGRCPRPETDIIYHRFNTA
jgi:hypothetical protein